MLLQNLRAKMSARLKGEKSEAGFTLIELLVVMLILGILAAIAIPAFFNQRDKGTDAQAKAAARTAQTAIETWATDNGGRYINSAEASPTATELRTIEPTLNDATLANPTTDATSYTVEVTSDTTNVFKIIRSSDGTVDLECTTVNTDGCPGDTDTDGEGNWG